MKKRETIIVLLAGMLAVYGLLDYFVLNKKAVTGEEEKINAAIADATTFSQASMARVIALSAQGGAKKLDYAKTSAETPWPRDPFIYYQKELDTEADLSGEDMKDIIYSGFMRLGKNVLGIINGMEYGLGELIADLEYKVHQITPSKVILLTKANKQITIYLQED